ncbi:TetR/AcrR family transcriptional regulator [Citricoccus muralis]|uniref:TetR/AcrR family transcriptional regulator n=1 Tax=Citricoccus muralis TaxID=169134 RepID=A0ABY8H7L3_9MICC|nr:TetR/AcrR family transcriptional regulator [Citricoccus muralis]WFP17135.1 TetR/AcrR family transcriptional regulator [Citricoccus muralis]
MQKSDVSIPDTGLEFAAESTVGRREQQRQATLLALHEAAVAQVTEQGYEAATITSISDAAGVSRRTFFNYYATKDEAILGVLEPSVPPQVLEKFLEEIAVERALGPVVRLLMSVMSSSRVGGETRQDLMSLAGLAPSLSHTLKRYAVRAEDVISEVLVEHLAHQDGEPRTTPDVAHAMVMIAGTALRFAYAKNPDSMIDPDSPALVDAVELFSTTLKEVL